MIHETMLRRRLAVKPVAERGGQKYQQARSLRSPLCCPSFHQ